MTTLANYYGCLSTKHTEHTCLSHYHQTTGRRKFRYDRWCSVCKLTYKNPDAKEERDA